MKISHDIRAAGYAEKAAEFRRLGGNLYIDHSSTRPGDQPSSEPGDQPDHPTDRPADQPTAQPVD
ncbi:hypothetical protein ACFQYP_40900 [Nonomuraea antimicrobica]